MTGWRKKKKESGGRKNPLPRRARLPFYISREDCKIVKMREREYSVQLKGQMRKSSCLDVTAATVALVVMDVCPSRSVNRGTKWVRLGVGGAEGGTAETSWASRVFPEVA